MRLGSGKIFSGVRIRVGYFSGVGVPWVRDWNTLYGWESTGGARVRVDTLGIERVRVDK